MVGSYLVCPCRLKTTDFKKIPVKHKRRGDSSEFFNTSGLSTQKTVTKACSVCQVNLPLYGSVCECCSLNGALCPALQQLRPFLPHDPGVRTRSRRPKCRHLRLPKSDSEISGIQPQLDNLQPKIQEIPLLWTEEVETCRIQAEQRRDVPVQGGNVRELHAIPQRRGPDVPYRIQPQREAVSLVGTGIRRTKTAPFPQVSQLYQTGREIQHRRAPQSRRRREAGRQRRKEISGQGDQIQASGIEKEGTSPQAKTSLSDTAQIENRFQEESEFPQASAHFSALEMKLHSFLGNDARESEEVSTFENWKISPARSCQPRVFINNFKESYSESCPAELTCCEELKRGQSVTPFSQKCSRIMDKLIIDPNRITSKISVRSDNINKYAFNENTIITDYSNSSLDQTRHASQQEQSISFINMTKSSDLFTFQKYLQSSIKDMTSYILRRCYSSNTTSRLFEQFLYQFFTI